MLKIAASIFGNPSDDEWLAAWNATLVGLEIRASMLCDLPLCIDEAGTSEASERTKSTYMLVNGTGRTRGAKDGGLRDGHSWRTVVISTGEERLVSTNAPTGAQVRVLDLAVSGFGSWGAKEVDACRSACEAHHGQVGRAWIEALAGLTDAERDELRADAARYRAQYRSKAPDGSLAARQAEYWAILGLTETLVWDMLDLRGEGQADEEETVATLMAEQADPRTAIVEQVRPASERGLDVVAEMVARERAHFPVLVSDSSDRDKRRTKWAGGVVREAYGYLSPGVLYVLPQALERALERAGIGKSIALDEWKARGVTVCDSGKRCTKIRVDGQRVWTVAIRAEYVGLDDGAGELPSTGQEWGAEA